MGFLRDLAARVEAGMRPTLTVLFDVPPAVSRERLAGLKAPDRFEQEQQAFFEQALALVEVLLCLLLFTACAMHVRWRLRKAPGQEPQ